MSNLRYLHKLTVDKRSQQNRIEIRYEFLNARTTSVHKAVKLHRIKYTTNLNARYDF